MIELWQIKGNKNNDKNYLFVDKENNLRSLIFPNLAKLNYENEVMLYENTNFFNRMTSDKDITITTIAKVKSFKEQLQEQYPELLL